MGDDGIVADIEPFLGFRLDTQKAALSEVLAPPYDVISTSDARRLRRLPFNAIHLELPEGRGFSRYRKAARLWKNWRENKIVVQETRPAIYVLEERFFFGGKNFRRVGFLAALSLDPKSRKSVLPHEKTLSAPKADRLRILNRVRVNFSPIFAAYPDPNGRAKKILESAMRKKVLENGVLPVLSKTKYRLWREEGPEKIAALRAALKKVPLLIADGHHRLGAACDYFKKNPAKAAGRILAYFCAEDDSGLLVLPTHRVSPIKILSRARRLCRLRSFAALPALLKALSLESNPYALGIAEDGAYYLAIPKNAGGCRSSLSVEWLKKKLFSGIAPDRLRYSHDASEAASLAETLKTGAIFVKPFSVSDIRQAAQRVGLLPQKSTYFYPKVPSGLVFHSLEK